MQYFIFRPAFTGRFPIPMLRAFVMCLAALIFAGGLVAKAANVGQPDAYVGKVMLEIIVFFPKEFDQLDENVKTEIKQAMKKSGAQEYGNELRMPMKPLIGAWLKTGKQPIMIASNGEFTLSSLPPNTVEIPIYQQLSDTIPLAKFPVRLLAHKGEKVQPFVVSIRMPYGECHSGKVDHTN